MARRPYPVSEVHLALMSEDGAMRFAYCALRTACFKKHSQPLRKVVGCVEDWNGSRRCFLRNGLRPDLEPHPAHAGFLRKTNHSRGTARLHQDPVQIVLFVWPL